MAGNIRLIERGAAPVLVACLLVLGAAPPPAAAQCDSDELLALDRLAFDQFGQSVSISGDVAVVGAWGGGGIVADSGSAYIFRFNGVSWAQEAKLTASDGAVSDLFGVSVSISGDVAVVGAYADDDNGSLSGSAYVFVKPVGGWVDMTQTAKLTASDGAVSDEFGRSVSISGDVAVVGAAKDDDNGLSSGSAYAFVKPPGGWVDMTQTAKLTASDGAASDFFGASVSISDEVAVIGAVQGDGNVANSGSAYVFVKPPGGWVNMTQSAKLTASDGAASDFFGGSVSLSGDLAVVTAVGDNAPFLDSGSAYVFVKPVGGWVTMTETSTHTAWDGLPSDSFGISVSISGDLVLVGDYADDDNGSNSGSAYVYDLSGVDCNLNGLSDACDIVLGMSCDFNANLIPDECELAATAGDISGPGGAPDGCVDAFDLGALLAAWCSVAGGNPCGTCSP
ncbi:MAG: hypothetical protein O7D97_05595 [Planctomycetota bacterium]|nr:hypothetical protein [Planctomycetota bacterium]